MLTREHCVVKKDQLVQVIVRTVNVKQELRRKLRMTVISDLRPRS